MVNARIFRMLSQKALGPGWTIDLRPRKPPKPGISRPPAQGWWRFRGLGAVGGNPGNRPFFRVKDHLARQVRAIPSPGQEMQDTPSDAVTVTSGALFRAGKTGPDPCLSNLISLGVDRNQHEMNILAHHSMQHFGGFEGMGKTHDALAFFKGVKRLFPSTVGPEKLDFSA